MTRLEVLRWADEFIRTLPPQYLALPGDREGRDALRALLEVEAGGGPRVRACDACRQFVRWRQWARSEPSALRAFLALAHREHRRAAHPGTFGGRRAA